MVMLKLHNERKETDWRKIAIDSPYDNFKLPDGFENWHSIGAHPDCVFQIEADKPVKICGYLNPQGSIPRPMSPIEVRIAEMIIGYLYLPGNRTHTVYLPAGMYEVRLTTADKNNQHSYLLFTDADTQ